jgi:hypothetical protein
VQALPQAAYLLFFEAAAGGAVALTWLALAEGVPRGFVRFTGVCLLVCAVLAVWLRSAFPTVIDTAGISVAVLAGAAALGSSLVALSLGHWYLVSPTMAVRPLVRVTFVILAALLVQVMLLLAALPSLADAELLLGVRVLFGLVLPIPLVVMTWRTARIRSLDSATGLLYLVVALVLAGEITARALFFLTGVAT